MTLINQKSKIKNPWPPAGRQKSNNADGVQPSQTITSQPQAEKSTTDKIEGLHKQIEELTNKWKRALADYQNLEKRVIQERCEFVKYSNAILINKLLEVMDNLEMAEQHIKDKGLSLAIHKLKGVLKDEGVEEISVGQKFDPTIMECIDMVEGKTGLEVAQKGYLLHKKVLRPIKVKVCSPDKLSGNIA